MIDNMKKATIFNIKQKELREFLDHSNWIEGEYGDVAFKDAMKAWKYLIKVEDLDKYSKILDVHKLLMEHLRPDIAGKFRNCDVWIGGQHKRFINQDVIVNQIGNLLYKILKSILVPQGIKDKEEFVKECHVEFENIHPFEDGNGRIGRLIYNWHRIKLGLPLHIIHEGHEQFDYYKWFKK